MPEKSKRRNTGDLNDLTGTEWIKATKSWFVCDSRRYHRNRRTELHPARFPEEMVSEFLLFFTKREGWVLDPFCGSGATLVSCLENERRGVGVELSERYAQVAGKRVTELDPSGATQVLCGDARRLTEPALWPEGVGPERDDRGLPQFDFIITSPPYCNMLRTSRGGVVSAQKRRANKGLDTHYSEAPGDLGNVADYEGFIEALGGVFDGCAQLLKAGKYLVCVVQNYRAPEGEVKPLAWDLARRIGLSLSFQGERIWCQDSKPLGIWGYPKVFVPNYHHHYCLIFRKRPEG
jgi:DNA modification methylase